MSTPTTLPGGGGMGADYSVRPERFDIGAVKLLVEADQALERLAAGLGEGEA